jgi:single-stranded DNA-binding protein
LVLEGRLRMNTTARADGIKEKKAEFTLSRMHPVAGGGAPAPAPSAASAPAAAPAPQAAPARASAPAAAEAPSWNTGPLVDLPDDEIPF